MKKLRRWFMLCGVLIMCMTACGAAEQTEMPESSPTATVESQPTTVPTTMPEATPTAEPTAMPEATPAPEPTAMPEATPTPEPTAISKPTATPTPKPTAAPTPTSVPLGDLTYDFRDLMYNVSYGLTYKVEKNGSLALDYERQWGEIRFALPAKIDMTKYHKLTVKLQSAKAATAVKLYDKDMNEIFAAYHCQSDVVTSFDLYPALDTEVAYIAFMSMVDGAYTASVEEITFHIIPDLMETVDLTYDYNELYCMYTSGLAEQIQEDGSVRLWFGAAYGGITFVLPQPIDLSECVSISVNAQSEDGKISMRLQDERVFGNMWAPTVFEQPGWKKDGKQEYKCYPDSDATVYSVAFFSDEDPAKLSDYEATIYDVTFHMKPGYELPEKKAETTTSGATLKNTYGTVIEHVGTALNSWEVLSEPVMDFVKKHYNTVVSGLEGKQTCLLAYAYEGEPVLLSTEEAKKLGYIIPDNYKEKTVPAINYGVLDTVMRVCAENGFSYRLHTLIWHETAVSWFHRNAYSTKGGFVSKDVMDARFEYYITNVVTHLCESEYKDILCGMDVINEYPHINNDVTWKEVYGAPTQNPEFVKKAFECVDRILRQYGMREQVSLVFNDYNTFDNTTGLINTIRYINSDGKICDGIGMQSHMHTHYPFSTTQYRDALTAFADAGLEIHITELDICISEGHTEADLARRYYEIMTCLLEAKQAGANITHLMWWGYADDTSWLKESTPLMFSTIGKPKDAYYKVLDAYEDAGYVLPK